MIFTRFTRISVFTSLFASFMLAQLNAQHPIEDVRLNFIKQPFKKYERISFYRDHVHYGSDESDEEDDTLMLYILGAIGAGIVITSPIWLVNGIFENHGFSDEAIRFAKYPYHGDLNGYFYMPNLHRNTSTTNWNDGYSSNAGHKDESNEYLTTNSGAFDADLNDTKSSISDPQVEAVDYVTQSHAVLPGKDYFIRFSSHYANDLNDTELVNFNLLFDTSTRIGVEVNASLIGIDRDRITTDQIWNTEVNLLYAFVQSERLRMRIGCGLRTVFTEQVGRYDSDGTFNLVYGGDWFVDDPMVISTMARVGMLSDDHVYYEIRSTIGVMLNRTELFTGYEFSHLKPNDVHGLISGVRVWF